jgi:hypothetical protein
MTSVPPSGIRDFRDETHETLELVRAIHARAVDAPLFVLPDEPGVEIDPSLYPGAFYVVTLGSMTKSPWLGLRAEFTALDDRRLELRFDLAGRRSRPLLFDVA